MTTKQPIVIAPGALRQIRGGYWSGNWQADFVTGLAGGMTLDSVLYVGREYLASKFPNASWQRFAQGLRSLRRLR